MIAGLAAWGVTFLGLCALYVLLEMWWQGRR